ncbi:MAG: hypothetical protein II875_14590 [Clostridia bacterium]|nr:hypothetical protein [Clostridia bacterium]
MAKLITKKEYKKRRIRYQIAAGLSDFLVTLAGLAVAFVCVVLIVELINWLRGDVGHTFGLFGSILERTLRTNP